MVKRIWHSALSARLLKEEISSPSKAIPEMSIEQMESFSSNSLYTLVLDMICIDVKHTQETGNMEEAIRCNIIIGCDQSGQRVAVPQNSK